MDQPVPQQPDNPLPDQVQIEVQPTPPLPSPVDNNSPEASFADAESDNPAPASDETLDYVRRAFGGCFTWAVLIGLTVGSLGLAWSIGSDALASLNSYLAAHRLTHLPVSGTARISYEFFAVVLLILFVAAVLSLFPVFLYRSFEQTKKARIQGDVWVDLMSLGYWTKLRLSAEAGQHTQKNRSRTTPPQRPTVAAKGFGQYIWALATLPDTSEETLNDEKLALHVFSKRFEENYGAGAFVWPMTLLTILYFIGWLTVLFPSGLTGGEAPAPLGGLMVLVSNGFGGYLNAVLSRLNSVSAAFLGAYLFSMQGLFWRYVRSDFKPTAIAQASLRIVAAWIVAFILLLLPAVSSAPSPALDASAAGLYKAIGFVAGLFPIQMLYAFVRSAATQISAALPGGRQVLAVAQNTELTELDGLDSWHADRLDEAGLRYVRGLATADFLDLLLAVRLPTETLVDWVDQALLRMHVSNKVWEAIKEKMPVRNATDLLDALDTPGFAERWKQLSDGIFPLDDLAAVLQRDTNIAHIRTFRFQQSQAVSHGAAFPPKWPIQN